MAHPDDESYATYGTVALHRHDPRFRLVVRHATDGDGGKVAAGVSLSPDGLGAQRRREDEAAWRVVGRVPDRHDWLGHRDGHLAEVPHDRLVDQVAAFLAEERPDVVVTFGPDGITGHPDHLAIGAATDRAFHRVRASPGAGLRLLLHCAIRESLFERHQQWRTRHGRQRWDPTALYHLRGTPDELIDVDVDTRPVATYIVAGLKEHATQRDVIFDPRGTDTEWSPPTRSESSTCKRGHRVPKASYSETSSTPWTRPTHDRISASQVRPARGS
ncbi:MAG TPA: PIG-L family deacetylase [Dermatophilaceae bacterium]|nr:PIG-L family deacetylase [Dermatophilaceae bacterium]